MPFVVAVYTAMAADSVFMFQKVRKRFGRRVFIVPVENTVLSVLKAAPVLQRPLDKFLALALLLRLNNIKQRHLRLLLAFPVFDALFVFLGRGLDILLHFPRFRAVHRICLIVGKILIFCCRLFVVKRIRLIVVDFYKKGFLPRRRLLLGSFPEKLRKFFGFTVVMYRYCVRRFSLFKRFRVG